MNQSNVNAEGGEVVQLPNGNATQLEGPSHKDGGIDLSLPDGSVVFSDNLGIKDKDGNFRSLAERKAYREKEVNRLTKLLSVRRDPLLKNSLERVKKNNAHEEMLDLVLQQRLNGNNGEQGTVTAMDGAAISSGMNVAGSLMGVYGSIQQAKEIGDWYAGRPQMPNVYEDYGKKSVEKLNELNFNLDTQKAYAENNIEKKLQQKEQNTAAQIDAAGGTLNLKRALRSASKFSSDSAYGDAKTALESDYTSKLAENTREIADVMQKADYMSGMGEMKAFENKQEAYDTYHSSKMASTSDSYGKIGGLLKSVGSAAFDNENSKINEDRINLFDDSNQSTYGTDDYKPPTWGIDYNFQSSNDNNQSTFGTTDYDPSKWGIDASLDNYFKYTPKF